jgi:hypothetical protein
MGSSTGALLVGDDDGLVAWSRTSTAAGPHAEDESPQRAQKLAREEIGPPS